MPRYAVYCVGAQQPVKFVADGYVVMGVQKFGNQGDLGAIVFYKGAAPTTNPHPVPTSTVALFVASNVAGIVQEG